MHSSVQPCAKFAYFIKRKHAFQRSFLFDRCISANSWYWKWLLPPLLPVLLHSPNKVQIWAIVVTAKLMFLFCLICPSGENPAAMQHGSHSTTCVPCPPLWFLSFLLSLTLQTFYLRFLSRNVDHNHHHQLQPTTSHHSEPARAHCDDDKEKEVDEKNEGMRNNNIMNKSESHHSTTAQSHHQNNHNHHSFPSFVDQVESQSTSYELIQSINHHSSHSRTKVCHQEENSFVIRWMFQG